MLSREQMLSHPPMLKTELIPVPEFGDGEVLAVRALTAGQRWKFGQMAAKAEESGIEPASYLITQSAINADGALIFQTQDLDAIKEWPGDLVDRISSAIMEMSGLSGKDSGKAGKQSSDSEKTQSVVTLSGSDDSSDAPPTS